jgi:SAM-dependent methyltransferase
MPTFTEKNPLLASFWDQRFAQDFMPWDRGDVPQRFADFCAASAPRRTLIAGCGRAYEALLLAKAGWDVSAIDFSPQAVAQAQALLGPHAACVRELDFFDFVPDAPFELIYERAFLCALPPARWPDIVARWSALLAVGGVLAGFFYFDEGKRGPPFGAEPQALQDLMQSEFALLEDTPVEDSISVFQGKERWMVWQKLGQKPE